MQAQIEQSFNQSTVDWKPDSFPTFDACKAPHWRPNEAAVNQFQTDGAVLVAGVFDEWVDTLRTGLQRNMDHPHRYAYPCESLPAGAPGRFFDSYCNWLLIPEFFKHITESCAASMAGELMRSETAQFFHEHSFCKEPGTQHATPWHQDMPYYCVDGTKTISLYVALDRTPAEVAIRFVQGSHRWNRLFQPVTFLDGAIFAGSEADLEAMPDFGSGTEDYGILAWDLEPGDCVAFDFRTIHGTTAGCVADRRRAVSTRWLGDDAVYCERPSETSPPYEGIGLEAGDRMREDWFPVLWTRA